MTASDPGSAPDLTSYDTTASNAAYEWLLSDHPWAVAERVRRAAAYHAGEAHRAQQVRDWVDRTRTADTAGDLTDRPAGWRDNLVGLADLMGPIADRNGAEAAVDDAEPDDLAVAESRRRWQTHMQVSGEGPDDYTYPAHLIGPGAAAYPPPPEGFPQGTDPSNRRNP